MKFLVIQTAFIGDVILATPVVEKLRRFYPGATIDFLLRKGNEGLLTGHPQLRKVWVWDKKKEKYSGLWKLTRQLRAERYDVIVNCQRFAASGVLTALSGAAHTVGFRKNPFSWLFSKRVVHAFGTPQHPVHEVDRNLRLIEHLTDSSTELPKLYPTRSDTDKIQSIIARREPFVCIAPTSVWFTKQYPAHKWVELIRQIPAAYTIFLLGGPTDVQACNQILESAGRAKMHNLAGQLRFLESAALMQKASMNYVNDSAPMHIASAMNAPTAAIFCSTIPLFGFTPLSRERHIIESSRALPCRPCGLHGYRACPQGHFDCAETVSWVQFPLPVLKK